MILSCVRFLELNLTPDFYYVATLPTIAKDILSDVLEIAKSSQFQVKHSNLLYGTV